MHLTVWDRPAGIWLVDALITVIFIFLFWRMQRARHCECNDLQYARRGPNSGSFRGLLGAMQMLFRGVVGSAIIALGGADQFSVTVTGLFIMALCTVLSSFLALNSR